MIACRKPAKLQDAENVADFIENNDLIVIDGVSGLSAAKIKQIKDQLAKEQARNLGYRADSLIDTAGTDNLTATGVGTGAQSVIHPCFTQMRLSKICWSWGQCTVKTPQNDRR